MNKKSSENIWKKPDHCTAKKKRNKFNEHKFMTKFDPNRIFQSRNKDV